MGLVAEKFISLQLFILNGDCELDIRLNKHLVNRLFMAQNRTWLAFANRKKCGHADAIHTLGFINWLMGKNIRFDIGDTVYLFMSDERKVRFKMIVIAKNCKREDSDFWIEKAPDDITYKLKLFSEYKGNALDESELLKHAFKGGRSLQTPICNNMTLFNYIKSVF